jgi:dGTPase
MPGRSPLLHPASSISDPPWVTLHPEVRARLEANEEWCLSPFAARSRDAVGRLRDEPEDPMRLAYQRDRDRIIHSKAFRRLKHKTQVFIAPQGDHYRTRLTHTMEVTQVARSVARALRLNEDLTEAIALGHDLGHTPFGHAGEDAMAEVLSGGFRHNEQSVRVIEYLEKGGRGLNLTHAVKEGILKHSKVRHSVADLGWGFAETLEGQLVKVSDSLAYVAHDIDDAIRAGVLVPETIPPEFIEVFGESTSQRINAFVCDLVDYNWRVAEGSVESWQKAVGNGQFLTLSPRNLELFNGLREFMFKNVYTNSAAKDDNPKTRFIVHALFDYYCKHTEELPGELLANPRREPPERLVADYIAGMSDRYALRAFEQIYIPRQWAVLS